MTTALVSVASGRKAKANMAMTGEITLQGKVLPIGGLKEKLIAAYKEGITNVIIPAGNVPNLKEIPEEVLSAIKIIPVTTIDEVLDHALVR